MPNKRKVNQAKKSLNCLNQTVEKEILNLKNILIVKIYPGGGVGEVIIPGDVIGNRRADSLSVREADIGHLGLVGGRVGRWRVFRSRTFTRLTLFKPTQPPTLFIFP